MKKKSYGAIADKAQPVTVKDCTFTSEAPVINDNLLSAIKSVAEAATANAKAIERIADRLWGPNDHRTCLSINNGSKP